MLQTTGYVLGKWLQTAPYIQLSRHGTFRYRRVIPPDIRPAAGKREILVSLRTKDRSTAEIRYLKVHLASEEWLQSLIASAPSLSAMVPSRSALGLRNYAIHSEAAAQLAVTYRRRSGADGAGEGPPPNQNGLTLSGALALYLEEKREEFDAYHGRERTIRYDEKRRVIRYLREALGSDREIASLTRQDARVFRDFLRQRKLSSASLQKIISVTAAIVQIALTEQQIAIRNPFHRFHVPNEIAAVEARLPLSAAEVGIARSLNVNLELSTIVLLLVTTGARLNEIAGLDWADVDLAESSANIPRLVIRTNAIRRLKTVSSRRILPLIIEASASLRAWRSQQGMGPSTGPVFPRYGRSGGSDAASAALMKALRKAGITDKRKSIHSIRHSVKQALRDVGCPKDVRDAIQGHAANSIAENYGLGHSLEVMRLWLERAAEALDVQGAG